MIYTSLGHPISQENIVRQNFGQLVNAPGGSFEIFEQRLNRVYVDDNGNAFRSTATPIPTPATAARALSDGVPLLYTTASHAMVQTALVYQVAPGGPVVVKGGKLWDPAPGAGWRPLLNTDAGRAFVAAWAIRVSSSGK